MSVSYTHLDVYKRQQGSYIICSTETQFCVLSARLRSSMYRFWIMDFPIFCIKLEKVYLENGMLSGGGGIATVFFAYRKFGYCGLTVGVFDWIR